MMENSLGKKYGDPGQKITSKQVTNQEMSQKLSQGVSILKEEFLGNT